MSTEENKAVARRILDEFINGGNWGLVEELFAPDFVNHSPGAGAASDREGLKQLIMSLRTAFPDLVSTVDDLVAEGDKVAIRMTVRGTHKGNLGAMPPTGRRFEIPMMSILRFSGGKAVERWNVSDELGLLRQLGGSHTTA